MQNQIIYLNIYNIANDLKNYLDFNNSMAIIFEYLHNLISIDCQINIRHNSMSLFIQKSIIFIN